MALLLALPMAAPTPAIAASRPELGRSPQKVLHRLLATVPAANGLNSRAAAALVFPGATAAGFEVGVGPSVVVVDTGIARNLTSSTLADDIGACDCARQGSMAGAGLRGNKITRISKQQSGPEASKDHRTGAKR